MLFLRLFLAAFVICSQGAEKYFGRGSRLNWPEGAESRESTRAVQKLELVKVRINSITFVYASRPCLFCQTRAFVAVVWMI